MMDTLVPIFAVTFDVFNVFSPTIGYFDQIKEFKKNDTSEGFSRNVPLILLVCNTLRVFFWFGKHFHIALLFQSIVMILMQLVVVYYCCKYDKRKEGQGFWNWKHFLNYFATYLAFILLLAMTSFNIGFANFYYVELLGTLSGVIEAGLGLPQLYQNFKTKDTSKFSKVLLATWFIGDLIKTAYFLSIKAPIQMLFTGISQIAIDCLLTLQVYFYSAGNQKVSMA